MTEKSYGVLNQEQIIELFEMRARLADLQASSIAPVHKVEAAVWREAADLLKRMEFVGWKDIALAGR